MSLSSTFRSILSWLWSLWNTGSRLFLIGIAHTNYGYKHSQFRQPISDMIREGWFNTIASAANAAARGYAWWFFISGFNMCILGLVLFHYIRMPDGSSRPAPVSFAVLSILLSILGILAQPEGGWWLVTLEALYVLYANYCYQRPSQTSQKKNK